MLWLAERLSLEDVCDGRYFMERLAAGLSVTSANTSRRGPNKTPDFVARDASGLWHVVECKGTQSGDTFSKTQIGDAGPPAVNGVAQKRSIVFPPGYTGQRLVSGLSIAVQGSAHGSRLRIVDPEPKEPFRITESSLKLATDAAARAVVARALRLAGFEIASQAMASPLGDRPSAKRAKTPRVERERARRVAERDGLARAELTNPDLLRGVSDDGRFVGRKLLFDLPRPIEVDGQKVLRAEIRQGVNKEILTELAEEPTIEDLLQASDAEWVKKRGRTTVVADGRHATFRIGDLFMSEIKLT